MNKNNNNTRAKTQNQTTIPSISRRRRNTQSTVSSAMNVIYKQSKQQISKAITSRYGGGMGLAKLGRDVSLLMNMVNTEDKYVDSILSTVACSQTAPSVQYILPPSQGTSNLQRIGNSIKVNRFDLQLLFQFTSGTVVSPQQNQDFRWFLVRYLKTTSATPFSITDFLNVDQGGNTTPLSYPNVDKNENFQIMCQGNVSILLPFSGGTTNSVQNKVVTVSHECAFHQTFNNTANTDITDGAVFLVAVALNTANTGGNSNIQVNVRQWYIDN